MRRLVAGLQPRGFGEIDPEPVAAALVAPGHLRRGVAELFLHAAFVDLGGGGEAGAQRMAGEFPRPFALGQVAAHTRRHGGLFHEAGDVLVRETFGADRLADDAAEQRTVFDSREFQPRLQRDDGAAELAGAAADFDLAPAGLAAQRDEDALVEDLGPAGSVLGLPGAAVEPDDFRAPQPAGEAEQQDRAVAQASEIADRASRSSPRDPRAGSLLSAPAAAPGCGGRRRGRWRRGGRRGRMFPRAARNSTQRREPSLEGGDRVGFSGHPPGGAGGDIEAQDLGVRGQGGQAVAARPGGIVPPVGSVGFSGVVGLEASA